MGQVKAGFNYAVGMKWAKNLGLYGLGTRPKA